MIEGEMVILHRTERSMVRAMCGVQLKDIKTSMDLMLMLGLNGTMDQLAMANIVHWPGHVLRREHGHVLRRALDLEVEGQRKPKRTWMKQVEEESVEDVREKVGGKMLFAVQCGLKRT